jgi:hypothetical protein
MTEKPKTKIDAGKDAADLICRTLKQNAASATEFADKVSASHPDFFNAVEFLAWRNSTADFLRKLAESCTDLAEMSALIRDEFGAFFEFRDEFRKLQAEIEQLKSERR